MEKLCVCVCVCVCVHACVIVCVCVGGGGGACMCKHKRKCVCVCVHVTERQRQKGRNRDWERQRKKYTEYTEKDVHSSFYRKHCTCRRIVILIVYDKTRITACSMFSEFWHAGHKHIAGGKQAFDQLKPGSSSSNERWSLLKARSQRKKKRKKKNTHTKQLSNCSCCCKIGKQG